MQRPSLRVQQRQGVTITPRLAQSIRMLAMDPGELDALVGREVERNPFLSRAGGSGGGGRNGGGDALPAIGERTAASVSLAAHLDAQIGLAFRDAADRRLAARLAGELDEAGYLREAPGGIAARWGVGAATLGRVLARCRRFEPAGLFARDLADCLALQLEARDRLDPAMARVLERLDLLARGDLAALAREAGLEPGDMNGVLSDIRACDPKPASGFGEAPPAAVAPVARVVAAPGGGWRVELIGSALPRVLVDHDYAAELRAEADAEAREWVAGRLADANWLARSLAQRARSLLRVTAEAVRRQEGYLTHGEAALVPLTQRALAAALDLHESTVSRVVSGKRIETPRGTVPLAVLFGAGVETEDGALAARAVQARIRALVDAEGADAVLSDEGLTRLLRAEGIAIARRTVAKYREGLGLASSAVRRRRKRAAIPA